jgi:hypothetical protein
MIKGNLVFMKNLYAKVALASVCTALGFALGANKEVKAATFILETGGILVADRNYDGLPDFVYGSVPLPVGIRDNWLYGSYGESYREEYRALYNFNIAHLSLASDTVISSATFTNVINTVERLANYHYNPGLDVIGYVGNGSTASSLFSEEGVSLGHVPLWYSLAGTTFNLNVTTFVNQIVSNRESVAGFGFRSNPFSEDDYYGDNGYSNDNNSYITLRSSASLTITTVDAEPVPEPTTIFGSVIGLCLGGWLKRKKSSQQNKITP